MARILIVGAGISGLTLARLATDRGHSAEVVDTKHYLGGCCADQYVGGCFRHLHGPHIMHTNDEEVWSFLSRFTAWTPYRHRVWIRTDSGILPVPFFPENGIDRTDDELRSLIFSRYSEKMWGIPWEQISSSIRSRVPSRGSAENPWYFQDNHQGLPTHGYSSMFAEMARGLAVSLGVSKMHWLHMLHQRPRAYKHVFCCRPHSSLPYRSIRFELVEEPQTVPVMNDGTLQNRFTRSTDYSLLSAAGPDARPCVVREYPRDCFQDMEPYYPDPDACTEDERAVAMQDYTRNGVVPLGRAATYKYLNMDQAVRAAMTLAEEML